MNGWKTIHFKVYDSVNKNYERMRFEAPKGQRYTQLGVERACKEIKEQLLVQFPDVDFKFVAIKPNSFNVLHQIGNA